MSGLLDKAKNVSKGDTVEGVTNAVGTADSFQLAKEGGLLSAAGASVGDARTSKKAVKSAGSATSISGDGMPSTAMAGFVLGAVALGVAVFMVWDLKNWEGIIPLGILILGVGFSSWGLKEMKGAWSKNGTIAIGVTFLLIAAVPYFAAFSWEGGNIRASNFAIDEGNDMLTFTIHNTMGDVADASISVKGEEVWSKEGIETDSQGVSEMEIALSSIYRGSTIDQNGRSALTYKLDLTAGSKSWSGEVTEEILDRTVTRAGTDMVPVTEQDESGNSGGGNGHTNTDHLGIQMKVGIGRENTNLQRSANLGEGEWDAYIQSVASDYTLTIEITKDGSSVWSAGTTLTVNGDSMSSSKGSGTLSFGWMELELSGMDSKGEGDWEINYIPRDDFYDGDGCYETTLVITHAVPGGDSFDSFTTTNGFHYYWEENENRESKTPYKPAVAC